MNKTVQLSDRVNHLSGSIALTALAVTAISALFSPERAWTSAYLSAFYVLTLGLGGTVFLAMANVTGAGWHVAFRRVPEALTRLLLVGGIGLLGLLALQTHRVTWHAPGAGDGGTFWFKELWLSFPFLLLRGALYLALWVAFTENLIRVSRAQDRLSDTDSRRVGTMASAWFLAVYAVTFSLATMDWVMALEPMWFSTIWGVYHFSGMFQAALAFIVIACIFLRRGGVLLGVFRDEHLHDLGKLLLGFSCFWMYIWFSQYMLIWYSNIPEETVYFSSRLQGSWGPMIAASLVLNWGIPFFVLLPRKSKRSEQTMMRVAVVVLIGRWIDLSVMIYPPVVGSAPALGIPEIAGVFAILGISIFFFRRAFPCAGSVPLNDPFLKESLHYSN